MNSELDLPHIGALCVITSYFIAIIGLFSLIVTSLFKSKGYANSNALLNATFLGLTLASLVHTWFYMFKYMAWSFDNYGRGLAVDESRGILLRIAAWLHDTSLFEQAWALVCFKPLNWWWSEQLCLFTVGAWTIFIATEGKRHQVKHIWAYMVLGQIVAISVASNLFYLAILLSPPPPSQNEQQSKLVSPRTWLSVLLSLVTVALSPFTSRQTFLLNLLAMHVLIFIPLLPGKKKSIEGRPSSYSMEVETLYSIVHTVTIAIHIKTTLAAIDVLNQQGCKTVLDAVKVAWAILHSNPAQSSIGWDVIWTSISFIVWMLTRPTQASEQPWYTKLSYLIVATPLVSVGVTAPYILKSRRGDDGPVADKRD